jgi:hypothetical protein
LAGDTTSYIETGGSNIGFRTIFKAIDARYPPVPDTGLSLADCLSSIPLMFEHLDGTTLSSTLVRGRCISTIWPGPEWRAQHQVVFHPSPLYAQLLDSLRVDPNAIDRIEIHEAGLAATVLLHTDWVNGGIYLPFPPAATVNTAEWRMWTNSPPLTEYGYLYVAVYLAGNYARYFPDKWLVDVEASTLLSLAIEELCALCEWRVPWLALCELDQVLYVPEA